MDCYEDIANYFYDCGIRGSKIFEVVA